MKMLGRDFGKGRRYTPRMGPFRSVGSRPQISGSAAVAMHVPLLLASRFARVDFGEIVK